MALPFDRERLEPHAHEAGLMHRHACALRFHQRAQMLMLALDRNAAIEHRDVCHQRRNADPRDRARMHLVVQRSARGAVGGKLT